MQRRRNLQLSILAVAAATVGVGSFVRADTPITSITPGDLIVLRGGDSTFSDGTTGNAFNGEVAAYLDEYTTGGTYVGTIDVDSSGDANTLTLAGYGTYQHEGALDVDPYNDQYITFGGYNLAPNTTEAGNTSDTVGHNIGILNLATATVNSSTQVNGVYNGSNPYFRGAVAANASATSFYTFGKYPNGGLEYVNGTGASPTITPIESYADVRNADVVNGQLYIGSGSSSVASGGAGGHALYSVAGGTPTSQLHTSTQANGVDNTQVTEYNGSASNPQSASNFSFDDITDSGALTDPTSGANVLYTIGDQDTPGIVKYAWNGSTWVSDGTVVSLNSTDVLNPVGISTFVDPSNPSWVDIYVSGENGIYSYVDESGNPSTAIGNNAFSLLATPGSNEAFYGIAYAAVPEPATLSIVAIGSVGLLARWRRSRA